MVAFAFHIIGYTSQITAGGTGPIHKILAPCVWNDDPEGGSLSFCHPVGFNLRSIRRINR